ncbi:MAG: hypothetical protein ABW277_08255 [Longimicrobiaceae bacterium]
MPGDATPAATIGELAFQAAVQVTGQSPRRMEGVVTVTNSGGRPRRLEYGNASRASRLRAYASPARTGDPVWDSSRWRGPGDAMARDTVLAPGGARRFALAVPLHEFLGDSLPDGRYYFTAAAFLDDSTTGELDAGEVVVRRETDPMPQERTVAGVAFRAEVVRLPRAPQELRFVLTVSNRRAEPVVLSPAPVPCNVTLEAYRSAEARDAWYLPGSTPDWRAPRCVLRLHEERVGPGESRMFEARVPLASSPAGSALRPPLHFAAFLALSGPDSLALAEMVAAGQLMR